MAAAYAKKQPAGFKNHVENIAIVGAGGNAGGSAAKALIRGGKHKVTAITRPDSSNAMPEGIHEIKHVNYDSRLSLAEALRGQDVLIITMNVMAPRESQLRLIDAAIEAGVKWIMPNEWGVDHTNESLAKETLLGERILSVREHVKTAGGDKTHFIGMVCGFWYEFSLAGTEARYGFNFEKKQVTFYNNGETKINTTTFPQLGRGIANLLSLKILPDDENDKGPYLSQYNNGSVYIDSFFVSQRDMFASVLRVTGDKEEDWTVSTEDVRERYKRGFEMMQKGQMVGFGILLYARVFYGDATFTDRLDNAKLGLPEENFDEWTGVAIEMAKRGEDNAI